MGYSVLVWCGVWCDVWCGVLCVAWCGVWCGVVCVAWCGVWCMVREECVVKTAPTYVSSFICLCVVYTMSVGGMLYTCTYVGMSVCLWLPDTHFTACVCFRSNQSTTMKANKLAICATRLREKGGRNNSEAREKENKEMKQQERRRGWQRDKLSSSLL